MSERAGRSSHRPAGLSPIQLRNLERSRRRRVIRPYRRDSRYFCQAGPQPEGKLQVELAQLNYELPRLSPEPHAKPFTPWRRDRNPGAGETKLETDRRRVRRRIAFDSQRTYGNGAAASDPAPATRERTNSYCSPDWVYECRKYQPSSTG